jgi:DNA-binding transcriptional regulator YiaG
MMTPKELKEARKTLGLTQDQMGRMLDTTGRVVRTMESDPSTSQHRTPAPRMERLIKAYLEGFRPDDWPK